MSGIELQGTDQMLTAIRHRLGNASARLESKALRSAAEVVAEEERTLVNISDSNFTHLRDDIYVSRVIRKGGQKYVLIRASKKTSWRMHFLEWGTSNMPAQPFKEPAFHAKKGQALRILADEFRKGLKE